jgi:GT2 family glycosyltransferase
VFPESRAQGSAGTADTVDVTVLVAVHNGMPYLADQLAALSRQAYSGRWELILSDNGSTDDSISMALAMAGQLPSLRVVDSSAVPGYGGALSIAIQVARGRFLLFCDHDDVVADGWVAAMAAALEKYPAAGGYLDEESLNPEYMRNWRPPATPGCLPRPFGLAAPLGANSAIRRDVYDEVDGFDLTFHGPAAMETDLFWRVQLAGHELAFVPEAVVAYRHRPDLRSTLRQWHQYGRGRAHLVARYRPLGYCGTESWRDVVATAAWAVLHSVDCLRGRNRRVRYLMVLSHVIGQVKGSMDMHILHVRQQDQPRAAAGRVRQDASL